MWRMPCSLKQLKAIGRGPKAPTPLTYAPRCSQCGQLKAKGCSHCGPTAGRHSRRSGDHLQGDDRRCAVHEGMRLQDSERHGVTKGYPVGLEHGTPQTPSITIHQGIPCGFQLPGPKGTAQKGTANTLIEAIRAACGSNTQSSSNIFKHRQALKMEDQLRSL